jgi:tetratricopeptide (TPR) repeat protein
MRTITIFLASSNELEADRLAFERSVGRKKNLMKNMGISLDLKIWEDMPAHMSQTSSQNEYNKEIQAADMFVLLAWNKVGRFTDEEFDIAYRSFKATGKPLIFVWIKKFPIAAEPSLEEFKTKLSALGFYYGGYTEADNLLLQFNTELERLVLAERYSISTQSNSVISYGSKEIKKYLGILPVIPEVFIGRDEKLQEVHNSLFDGDNLLLLVNGEGGIGKTTLAAKYYQRYFDEYAHLGWVFAERSLGDALLTLAEPLKVTFEPTDSADARREKLLCEMATLKKPCLLVIDNANDIDDLSAHYLELRRCPNFHILLTTRITEFAHASTCRVGHLDEAAAMRLFTTHYPGHDRAEDELLKEILRAVGYNTLVIELLAKNLDTLNQFRTGYALSRMLDDLRGSGLFGLSKSEKVRTEYNPGMFRLREEKPETVIAAMYDLAKLEPGEEQLLCVFSVLPAEPIAFATLEALQPGNDELEKSLRALVQKGWIEYNAGAKQFKCSPVVQAVTRHQVGDRLFEQCETLVNALIEKLKYALDLTGHLLHTDYLSGALYIRYAENIVDYLKSTRYEKSLLNDRIGMFYYTTGQMEKSLSYFDKCHQLCEELYDANPEDVSFKYALAVSYERLGIAYKNVGDLEKSLSFYEDATRLFEELYESDGSNEDFKKGLAVSCQRLGDAYTALVNLEKSLSFYEDATRLFEELCKSNRKNVSFKYGLASSYGKQGDTYRLLGKPEKALNFFKQFNQLIKEMCKSNETSISFKNGLAISFETLGDTYTMLGDLEKALSFYEDATRLFEELYEANPANVTFKNGLAISYAKLGVFSRDQRGDMAQARRCFEKAETLWAELVNDAPAYAEFKKNLAWVKNELEAL